MRNEINQGRKVRSRSEINNICLKQGRGSGLKASAAHLYTNFPWLQLSPHPHPRGRIPDDAAILLQTVNHTNQ